MAAKRLCELKIGDMVACLPAHEHDQVIAIGNSDGYVIIRFRTPYGTEYVSKWKKSANPLFEVDLHQCTCDCGCMYQTTSEICPDCKNGDHTGYAELY